MRISDWSSDVCSSDLSIGVGGNRFEFFDPSAVERAEEEHVQAWVARLRDALVSAGFVLHYQPVISLQGDTGPVYETFMRVDARLGELVKPLSFLQIAKVQNRMDTLPHSNKSSAYRMPTYD